MSLFVVTGGGVLVADGQGSVEETRRMLDEIGKITDQPVTDLVIGSDHGDHTAGNAAFPADINVYAHPTSVAALQSSAAARLERGDSASVPFPTHLVTDRLELNLGGLDIEILFLGRAHTGGDLAVHLPQERIAFLSEAYLNRVFPAMRSAYPSEWVEMIRAAQALDAATYVPGHGFVEEPTVLREELETYRQAVEQVIAEATRLHRNGLSADEAVEAAEFGELESWSLRASQGPVAIRRVYMELNGELPSTPGG